MRIALLLVVLFSSLSIILTAIHLVDYESDDTLSFVSIISTALLFILPWARSYIPYVGDWLFILTSLTSLISQAITYGKYVNEKSSDILAYSLLVTIGGAFFGHFIRKRDSNRFAGLTKKEWKEYNSGYRYHRDYFGSAIVHKLKSIFVILSALTYLINVRINPSEIRFRMLLILSLICMVFYIMISMAMTVWTTWEIYHLKISSSDMRIGLRFRDIYTLKKPINLILSVIPLVTFSIFVGESQSIGNILTLTLFIMAIAMDHVNALYFPITHYKSKILL